MWWELIELSRILKVFTSIHRMIKLGLGIDDDGEEATEGAAAGADANMDDMPELEGDGDDAGRMEEVD